MNQIEKDNMEFVKNMKNIIKNDDGTYKLQNNYYIDNNGNPAFHVLIEDKKSCCELCSHCVLVDRRGTCNICDSLYGKSNVLCNTVIVECAAYDEVHGMNIIKSLDDMISFIERTENFFGCPEDFEYYYGFERDFDEDTGKIFETVREYYNNGGTFNNIPNKYPCAIRFDLNVEEPLEWIYIGK